jgi:hypothetical protein
MEPSPAALLRQQDLLQAEAQAVEDDLGLRELLMRTGQPVRVGSSALGLMACRDLDITVICPRLDVAAVADAGARLAGHPRIRKVVFRDDTGAWNTDPDYPDGLYLGLAYRSPRGHDWTADIWFVDQPERQPDLAHLESIPPQLTAATRTAILTIKAAWAPRPEYGKTVRSFDIYTAVLSGGVRTRSQFGEWLASKRAAPDS